MCSNINCKTFFNPNRVMKDEGFSDSVCKRTSSIILEPVLCHATIASGHRKLISVDALQVSVHTGS